MFINSISFNNQRYFKNNKVNLFNKTTNTNTNKKPNTSSFNSRKAIGNAIIGAAAGGATTGYIKNRTLYHLDFDDKLKHFSLNKNAKLKYNTQVALESINAINRFWSKTFETAKKITSSEELSAEEKDIAKSFNMDTPVMRSIYSSDNHYDRDCVSRIIKTFEKITQKSDQNKIELQNLQISTYRTYVKKLEEGFINQAKGIGDASNSFELLDVNLKNLANDTIKNAKKDADGNVIWPGLLWIKQIEPNLEQEDLISNFIGSKDVGQTVDNYLNSVMPEIKHNIKTQIIKKETLKAAGIGALILGGAVTVRSFIYEKIKKVKSGT